VSNEPTRSKKLTWREGNPERARLVRTGSALVLVAIGLSNLGRLFDGAARWVSVAVAVAVWVVVIALLIRAMRLPPREP
jgi:hypothetical protein